MTTEISDSIPPDRLEPLSTAEAAPEEPKSIFRLGLRAKLFLISLGAIMLAVAVAHTYLSSALDHMLTDRIEADLYVRAELASREAADAKFASQDFAAWDALANDLGKRAHARVTLIDKSGVVVGDSEVPLDQIANMENHAGRPEVQGAFGKGRGDASRTSVTVHERMLYVAVPYAHGAEIAGVVRLALPLVEVESAESELNHALLWGSMLAFVVAAMMSAVSAELASRTARKLTDVARAMAKGDFTVRAKPSGHDELALLGRALDQLAESLSRTLAKLRAERDFIGRIVNGMQEGVLLTDTEGKVALVNSSLRQMLLIGANTHGKAPLDVVANEEIASLIQEARVKGVTASAEIELSGLKPRRLLVRAVPLVDEPHGVLAVFVDVTEIRRLETLRRDFVANASHELRTPVTAVRSAAETLRGAAASDPEAALHFMDIIERNAERLQLLVEDLLDLSRIEAREFRLAIEDVDLATFVDQIHALFRGRSEKKRIRLKNAVPVDLVPAKADRRAVEQILTNLVDNALKYSPEGAEIVVGATREAGVLRVFVRDTGPGIEQRHLPRLFERFYRVDTGRSRELGGTGLGLSIVKHLVEALGGMIGVESAVGKGTTFAFTLPIWKKEDESAAFAP